jgi:hypothetical protein
MIRAFFRDFGWNDQPRSTIINSSPGGLLDALADLIVGRVGSDVSLRG